MQYKKITISLLISALVVAGALGAVAYRSVFAATPTTTSTSSVVEVSAGLGPGLEGGYTRDDLAEALGISVEELNTAYQEAYTAALADAVSQGLITQAQADTLATGGRAFPFGGQWKGWLAQNGLDINTYLADALGISVDELQAAYQTAFNARIDQAVADGKLTQEQADLAKGRYALSQDSAFQSSMQSAFTEAVNQAVASGIITQAQADQILSKAENMYLPGLGGPGGHGGPRGGPRGEMEFGDPSLDQ